MKIMTERQFYEELHEREKVRQEIHELRTQINELQHACKHNSNVIANLEMQIHVIQKILERQSFISKEEREEMIMEWLDGTER